MGRPVAFCCNKIGVKKGPWTPEEDIILVSYIHEHGPANWRSVPANTGLSRCSKSCRLRWTNYLRPGIKRGNFSEHEEKMIIHLQALLGNRWAAIASYLPHRTDNDVKNYWNTHLRKKLGKQQQQLKGDVPLDANLSSYSKPVSVSKGQWERRLQTDIQTAKQALSEALSFDKSDAAAVVDQYPSPTTRIRPIQTSTYAVNTDNIARLLENWKSNDSPKSLQAGSSESNLQSPSEMGFESSNMDIVSMENSDGGFEDERKGDLGMTVMPLRLLEKWLLDESGVQGQDGDFMGIWGIEGADAGLL